VGTADEAGRAGSGDGFALRPDGEMPWRPLSNPDSFGRCPGAPQMDVGVAPDSQPQIQLGGAPPNATHRLTGMLVGPFAKGARAGPA
jgi:hypothetical protein